MTLSVFEYLVVSFLNTPADMFDIGTKKIFLHNDFVKVHLSVFLSLIEEIISLLFKNGGPNQYNSYFHL